MADVQINLKAAHAEFVDSLNNAATAAKQLVAILQKTKEGHTALSVEAQAAAQKTAEAELKTANAIVQAKQIILRAAKSTADQQLAIDEKLIQSSKATAAAQLNAATQGAGTFAEMSRAAKGHLDQVAANTAAGVALAKNEARDTLAQLSTIREGAKGTYEEMTRAKRGHFRQVKAEQKQVTETAKLEHKTQLSEERAAAQKAKEVSAEVARQKKADLQAVTKAAKDAAKAEQAAHSETLRLQRQNQKDSEQAALSQISFASRISAAFAIAQAVIGTLSTAAHAVANVFKQTVTIIDDFKKQVIGTAAAITNIRDEAENLGKTWEQTFHQNLKATIGTFLELERLSARYFATASDLQLAYNAFAQRGIVVRKEELKQLAQTTDLILLLTQGQQSTIQVQEEIRSLINGTLRPTAQLGQLLKSYGKDIKDVAANIRAFQSLRPLEDVLRGAALATNEIQKTFQATLNGLEVITKQIIRVGGEQFFDKLVGSVQKFTEFLTINRSTIAGYFAVGGNIVADTLGRFESFLELLINGNKAAGDSAPVFIKMATAIQVVGIALGRLVQLLALLLRDLPLVIDAFSQVFTEEQATKTVTNIDKIKQSLVGLAKQSVLGKLIEQFAQFSEAELKFPGQKGLEKALLVAQKISKIFLEDLQQIGGFDDLGKLFTDTLKSNVAAAEKGKKDADALLSTGKDDFPAPSSRAFVPNPEDVADLRQASAQAQAAIVQADRAARQAANVLNASEVEIGLQNLRRDLALIEDGFIVVDGVLTGFRSTTDDVANFTMKNLRALATGTALSFAELSGSIQDTTGAISGAKFENLENQLLTARAGLDQFVTDARAKNAELLSDTLAPIEADVQKRREELKRRYVSIIAEGNRFVAEAKATLKNAFDRSNVDDVKSAQAALSNAESLQRIGAEAAEAQRSFSQETIDQRVKEIEALTEKSAQQTATQIGTETNRILSEELRIRQAINAEIGKSFKTATTLNASFSQLAQKIEESRPRTRLQGVQADISATEGKLNEEIGTLKGQLQGLTTSLSLTWFEGGRATEELKAQIVALRALIPEQEKRAAQLTAEQRLLADLHNATEAVGAAVKGTADLMLNALTDSFEGKKTDFIRGFKSISDSLFKDAMGDVVDSLKKGAQSAFQSLAGKIPGTMGSVLGPAFLAGFAIIASFVLGQLLGGQGGEGSPGNPTVGIQSTEQVRGLIGGETQIPIGQIAESLQDALVPTNLWLARIAANTERLGTVGGLSATQVEGIIERSITDALQIQPA